MSKTQQIISNISGKTIKIDFSFLVSPELKDRVLENTKGIVHCHINKYQTYFTVGECFAVNVVHGVILYNILDMLDSFIYENDLLVSDDGETTTYRMNIISSDEFDNLHCEVEDKVTFEALMEKYKDHMTPQMKAQLNAINLASSMCNKQRAEQQLKNIAPFLAGDSMIKNTQEKKVVSKGLLTDMYAIDDFDNINSVRRYKLGDYLRIEDDICGKVIQTESNKYGHWYRCVIESCGVIWIEWYRERNVCRKATTLEVIQQKAMYEVMDFVVTDGVVYQIGDRGLSESGEVAYAFVGYMDDFEKQDNIERKATPQEIKEHTAPYNTGDYVKLNDTIPFRGKNAIARISNKSLRHDLCYSYEFEGIEYGYALDGIERKATEQEITLHKFPYKVGDYVITGFNNRVQQIKEISVLKNVIVKLDDGWGLLPSSVINRVATKGEILQHQHGLEKGDWVIAWDWITPRTIAKFETFTDSGKYMLCQGHPISFTDFKKLPKDFDMNSDKIKL